MTSTIILKPQHHVFLPDSHQSSNPPQHIFLPNRTFIVRVKPQLYGVFCNGTFIAKLNISSAYFPLSLDKQNRSLERNDVKGTDRAHVMKTGCFYLE